jgi:hypothetical protein
MANRKSVVYVGPDPVFKGLRGRLVDAIDPATRTTRLHFQPESDGIKAVPCNLQDVRAVDQTV